MPTGRRLLPLTALLLAALPTVARAGDDDAVHVYKQLKSSVVSLENLEGSGTGILVGTDGLILTNAHVVASPLPFTVKVQPPTGDEVTFHNVRIVGYHPKLDLALVKIDPAEHPAVGLHPVAISHQKAEPGQRVFVIGDPGAGGMVLTKTITSGMISGVDREVDGERYYQTDAAINPGNSGGPICDSTGRVLGLVTFKFEDVQATGFAIPLYDVDLKTFVPINRRKTDPAKAAELSKLAQRFAALADQAGREQGMDSDDRKQFNAYAAVCYHEAVLADPTNPDLYYQTGMLLRMLDTDDVAAGYLTRAIELKPWDDFGGSAYRELGLTLAKLKRDDQAEIVWHEGVAKNPYNAKVWEDLAIHAQNTGHPLDAVVDAATAAAIGDADTRTTVLDKVSDDARGQLSAADAKRADAAVTPKAITAALDKLLAGTNAARRKRQLYVTPAFATLIKKIGGAPVPGVESTVPTAPLPRRGLAAGSDTGSTTDADKPARTAKPDAGWVGGSTDTPSRRKRKPSHDDDTADDKGTADATGGWVGGAAAKVGKPIVTGVEIGRSTHDVHGAEVTPLDVTGPVDAVFSADGKFAFVLEKAGVVRKVAVDGLTEERKLDLASPCSAIARTKAGLVVAVTGAQEVWLMDDDLNVKKRFPSTGVKQLVGSPALPYAYATAGGDDLQIIDLNTGTSRRIQGKDFADDGGPGQNVRVAFWHIAAEPDGKYLWVEGDNVNLMRFKVRGSRISYDGASPVQATNIQGISVSGDSRYVAVLAGAGNYIEGQRKTNYATYVFAVGNLNRPATVIDSGAYPQALGFDTVTHTIYAQNYQEPLILFNGLGEKGESYAIVKHGSPKRFVVDPLGKRLFALDDDKLYWVTLP